jgi:ankyrin repeat protein
MKYNFTKTILTGSYLLSGFITTLPQLQAVLNYREDSYRHALATRTASGNDFSYLCGLLSGDGTEELRALIDFGAFSSYAENPLDPNVQDQFQQTILHFAAKQFPRDPSEDIDLLVRAGAIVNAKDDKEQTPLHFAAMYGHPEGIKKLLELGADVNAQDTLGRTPLYLATSFAEHSKLEKIRILLRSGANPNTVDKEGNDPLMFFENCFGPEIAQQAPEIRNLFEEYKAFYDILTPDEIRENITPLHKNAAANEDGSIDLMQAFLNFFDANSKDSHGQTPLYHAAFEDFSIGNPDKIKILVANGTNVNAQNNEGETALCCLLKGIADIPSFRGKIQTLLECGANPKIPDHNGITPLTRTEQELQEKLKATQEVYDLLQEYASRFPDQN